jgi:hypothetical protein
MTSIQTHSARDSFAVEMALDVTMGHQASGCCTPETPCPIVAVHQGVLESIKAGHGDPYAEHVDTTDHSGHRPAGGATGANQFGAYKVRMPSPAQLRFIARLLVERILPDERPAVAVRALDALNANKLNLRQASDLLDWLTALPEREVPAGQIRRPASNAAIGFLVKLAGERVYNTDEHPVIAKVLRGEPTEAKDVSANIDWLKAQPYKPREAKVELEAGIYLHDGVVCKVQRAVHGSGNMYAKVLDTTTAKFEYATGLVTKIKAEERMTLEQAKEFGAIYGVCCNCGATLTDERSIEAGIGPICAKKFA